MHDTSSKSYSKYVFRDGQYQMIGATLDSLPCGFYRPFIDGYGNPFLNKQEISMPKLYELPNDTQSTILNDVKKFWESEDRYRKFGSVYKRNILLYSVPGNGKTSLIQIISNKLINEYNGLIIMVNDCDDLMWYGKCVKAIREIEPNRKMITIIEDFENLTSSRQCTGLLLQLLDGNAQIDNMVTIATTNFPQEIETRFTCRPSRFNLVIEYKKPNDETRRAYITNKLIEGGIDVSSESVKDDIERLVGKSNGFTFDFVKEMIQCIYIDGINEDDVFDRLNGLIDKNGNLKVTEFENGKSSIGFDIPDECDDIKYVKKSSHDRRIVSDNYPVNLAVGC